MCGEEPTKVLDLLQYFVTRFEINVSNETPTIAMITGQDILCRMTACETFILIQYHGLYRGLKKKEKSNQG